MYIKPFSNSMPSDFPIEGLRLITTCPICNTQYKSVSAKIVEEREGAHLIHIKCKNCGSSIVALVLVGGLGVSSVGLICDLTPEDVFKFKDSKVVDTDDVIAIHELLNKQPNLEEISSI